MAQVYHVRQLHADLETPVSAYLKLRGLSPWSFLLESVEGPEHWATYSILGIGRRRVFTARQGQLKVENGGSTVTYEAPDPLQAIRTALRAEPLVGEPDAPAFVGGIFGFLAYDAVRYFERLPCFSGAAEIADACFFEPELLAVFDNRRHTLALYSRDAGWLDEACRIMLAPLPAHPAPAAPWQEPTAVDPRQAFEMAVQQAKEHIRAGDIFQVVLSRRFELPPVADPFDVYRGLRLINPSPYLYFFSLPQLQLAGASPEVMVRVQNRRVTVRPIAGTKPRGQNTAEDLRLAHELLNCPKERAEHIMLVDLGRNDVGRVSMPGSVQVADLMVIENYSHVMHIVSQVHGELAPAYDCFDALRATFPAGTLSGAPKVRAMEIIEALERRRRGIYGGAVGHLDPNGDADFAIAIRTLIAQPGRFVIQAGAGIVADSIPANEADETEQKAQAVMRAARWAASAAARW